MVVLGAGGQLGQELLALARSRGVEATGRTSGELDITDEAAVAELVARRTPRLIVNAAAYTAVDRAENEPAKAEAGNALGPKVLARETAAAGIPILHVSTDYVFDGTKQGAYTEDDPIAPLGVYGRTKAAGENAVRAANPRHLILRTSWLYGCHGGNFLKTMMRRATETDTLRVVADQRGCPTATLDLAEAILAADAALARDPTLAGTFHFAGSGATSWYEFARAIVDCQAEHTGKRPEVVPIATADYPTAAVRPRNSELDSTRFARVVGYRAIPWRERTDSVVRMLAARSDQA